MHLIVVVATVCYLVMLPLLFLAALGLDQYRARRFRRRLEQEQQNYQAQWRALQAQVLRVLAQLQALREEQVQEPKRAQEERAVSEATARQQELARQQEREHRTPNWIL
jgi:uncharacterized membrane protein